MLELGDHEKEEHRKIGELLGESRADMIFLYGREMETAAGVLEKTNKVFFHTDSMEKLSSGLRTKVRNGDLILLKASRGCALETLSGIVSMEEKDVS
jgi:UDP-N-acetylmuramoyl-tripeptide--D-alanyl-D-alanine ligase